MKKRTELMENTAISRSFGRLGIRERTLLSVGIFSLIFIVLLLIGGFIREDTFAIDLTRTFAPPSREYVFGTDAVGRDMLMRTLKGLSLSMRIGLLCSFVSCLIAVVLGIMAPLAGGKTDMFISWLIDLALSVPHTLIIILISMACGGGVKGIMAGIIATHWTSLTRVIRAEVMQLKEAEYTKMARRFGKNRLHIAKAHILPHLIPQLVVGTVLLFPHAILHEAAATFLGFGLPEHEPAIGVILSESMNYLSSGKWWLGVFPGASLVTVSVMVNTIGRNLEKLINPKTAYQ